MVLARAVSVAHLMRSSPPQLIWCNASRIVPYNVRPKTIAFQPTRLPGVLLHSFQKQLHPQVAWAILNSSDEAYQCSARICERLTRDYIVHNLCSQRKEGAGNCLHIQNPPSANPTSSFKCPRNHASGSRAAAQSSDTWRRAMLQISSMLLT